MPMNPADKARVLKALPIWMFERVGETATVDKAQLEAMIDPVYDAWTAAIPGIVAALPEPFKSATTVDQKRRAMAVILAVESGLIG